MKSVEAVADKIIPQSLNGEISVDNAHDAADKEEQQQNLYAVIDEEVDGSSQGGSAVQSYDGIYKPIGKLLYHHDIMCYDIPSNFLISDSEGTFPFSTTLSSMTIAGVDMML